MITFTGCVVMGFGNLKAVNLVNSCKAPIHHPIPSPRSAVPLPSGWRSPARSSITMPMVAPMVELNIIPIRHERGYVDRYIGFERELPERSVRVICMYCKNLKVPSEDRWRSIEQHLGPNFSLSHGICPTCAEHPPQ